MSVYFLNNWVTHVGTKEVWHSSMSILEEFSPSHKQYLLYISIKVTVSVQLSCICLCHHLLCCFFSTMARKSMWMHLHHSDTAAEEEMTIDGDTCRLYFLKQSENSIIVVAKELRGITWWFSSISWQSMERCLFIYCSFVNTFGFYIPNLNYKNNPWPSGSKTFPSLNHK